MFMEYRRELKVLFDNITQLVSYLLAVCSIRVLSAQRRLVTLITHATYFNIKLGSDEVDWGKLNS